MNNSECGACGEMIFRDGTCCCDPVEAVAKIGELTVKVRTTYVVAVYECEQAYGGPQEGGWWFDVGTLARVVKTFASETRAYGYMTRLNRRLKSRAIGPNQGRRDYSSVLSDGEYFANVYENTAPEGFPDRKPRYEQRRIQLDPNANLKEQRDTIHEINLCHDKDHPRESCACAELGDRLAELVGSLDGWLSRGGGCPTDWGKR